MRVLSRAFVLVFIVCLQSKADEPIMNMMPRWSGGWGYEFHYEYRTENDLLMGSEALHKGFSGGSRGFPYGLGLHLEKEVRITAKLPRH